MQQPEHQLDADMSPVERMFAGRSIFITGASGFIGRVLLEKLLRCYPQIRQIYILLRTKKNVKPADRLHKHLFNAPIFDRIKSMPNGAELLAKVIVVPGDIGEPELGISHQDRRMMLEDPTLALVFHSAATVKFDEPLRTSVKFNLVATRAMLDFCRQLTGLLALCHVSTAYVNSQFKHNEEIEERIYRDSINMEPNKLIQLVECTESADLIQSLQTKLVDRRPNTYTYTKAVSELLVQEAAQRHNLPVAIVRPSIVVASWQEPIPGWVDNLNGPTGLVLAIGKGLLRSMHARHQAKADLIPVDIVVNTMIASSFYVATQNNLTPELKGDQTTQETTQEPEKETPTIRQDTTTIQRPPIFHCTSGDTNPITWGQMEGSFFSVIRTYPSRQVFRYPYGTFKNNKLHDQLTRLIVHYLPALLIDLLCLVMGKKRQLMSIYMKLHGAVAALSHFTTTNYEFKSTNMRLLERSLSHERDRGQLTLSIKDLDWTKFWHDYVLGARRFVLKEEDHTLEESRKSFQRARRNELIFRAILVILFSVFVAPMLLRPLADGLGLRAGFKLAV